MRLTQENAHLYVGKKVDANKRLYHYYPLEVKEKLDEKYRVKDAVGVCMEIPLESDFHNRIDFDFIVGN
jgi:hypothetical protein